MQNIEDDRDVRNLIYTYIQMNANMSDGELRREAIEKFGHRYPNMSLNDWRHIIEDYTPMIREATVLSVAKEVTLNYDMAAEPNNNEDK